MSHNNSNQNTKKKEENNVEEKKENMQKVTKEEILDILDDVIVYSRARAMFFRIVLITIICVGTLLFLGLGNKDIGQYIALIVVLAAAYACGRNDFRQGSEESQTLKIRNLISEASAIDSSVYDIFDEDGDDAE